MSKLNLNRAIISPISEGTPRPLWSVMIPTYNCASYLRETLASVLAQDPGPEVMQIEVIDDCSTKDNPEAVVRELAGDRVGFYRQPQNVGHSKNFATCLQRSRGQLVHLLHGDDCVRDGFYQKMQTAFNHPEVGAAFCRQIYMNERGHWQLISDLIQSESGVLDHWLERIITKQYIQTPSIVVRREVYEKLGGFDHRFLYYGEDWEMWVRIATQYAVWFEVEPLAIYRCSSTSNTGRSVRTGENVQDLCRGHQIIRSYLFDVVSKPVGERLLQLSRKNWSNHALHTAYQLLTVNDLAGASAQIRESLKLGFFPSNLKLLVRLILKIIRCHIKRVASIVFTGKASPLQNVAKS